MVQVSIAGHHCIINVKRPVCDCSRLIMNDVVLSASLGWTDVLPPSLPASHKHAACTEQYMHSALDVETRSQARQGANTHAKVVAIATWIYLSQWRKIAANMTANLQLQASWTQNPNLASLGSFHLESVRCQGRVALHVTAFHSIKDNNIHSLFCHTIYLTLSSPPLFPPRDASLASAFTDGSEPTVPKPARLRFPLIKPRKEGAFRMDPQRT